MNNLTQEMNGVFRANAVWKTTEENVFEPAGFDLLVQVEPVSQNIMPDSASLMFEHIKELRCDGFEIDLGTKKKYMVRG
jgi:hypothetical protein